MNSDSTSSIDSEVGQDQKVYSIDVWYCKSLLARIAGGLPLIARRAQLEWNLDTKQVRCLSAKGNRGMINEEFSYDVRDFAYASLSIDLIYFKTKLGKSYQFQPRSDLITIVYAVRPQSMASNVLGAVSLKSEGIQTLLDMLTAEGVRVAKPHFLRGILVGLAIGIFLMVSFFGLLVLYARMQ